MDIVFIVMLLVAVCSAAASAADLSRCPKFQLQHGSFTRRGQIVSYACDNGFELKPSIMKHNFCNPGTGTWQYPHPKCIEKTTCDSPADSACGGGAPSTVRPTTVNGHWSMWATWSSCTVSCGQGKKVRHRQCDNPAPANDGKDCRGNNMETATCKSAECPIAGNWGDWSPWMPCSQTCGNGEKTRTRLCNNPRPQFGGDDCNGDDIESTTCNPSPCPIHGGWSEWTEWGQCSEPCGEGLAERSRTCDSPLAQHGGRQCTGKDSDRQPCNLKPCAPPSFTLPPLEDADITAAGELFLLHKDQETVSLYHPDAAAGFRLQWTRPAPAAPAGESWDWIYAAGDGRALLHDWWRETVLLEADGTEAGRWVGDLVLLAASSRRAVYKEGIIGYYHLHVYAVTDHSTRLFSLTPRHGGRWGSPRVGISPAGTILVADHSDKLLAAFSSAGERLYQVRTAYTPSSLTSNDQHVFVLDDDHRAVQVHAAASGDHVTTLTAPRLQLQDGEEIWRVWAGKGQTLYVWANIGSGNDAINRIITYRDLVI